MELYEKNFKSYIKEEQEGLVDILSSLFGLDSQKSEDRDLIEEFIKSEPYAVSLSNIQSTADNLGAFFRGDIKKTNIITKEESISEGGLEFDVAFKGSASQYGGPRNEETVTYSSTDDPYTYPIDDEYFLEFGDNTPIGNWVDDSLIPIDEETYQKLTL